MELHSMIYTWYIFNLSFHCLIAPWLSTHLATLARKCAEHPCTWMTQQCIPGANSTRYTGGVHTRYYIKARVAVMVSGEQAGDSKASQHHIKRALYTTKLPTTSTRRPAATRNKLQLLLFLGWCGGCGGDWLLLVLPFIAARCERESKPRPPTITVTITIYLQPPPLTPRPDFSDTGHLLYTKRARRGGLQVEGHIPVNPDVLCAIWYMVIIMHIGDI